MNQAEKDDGIVDGFSSEEELQHEQIIIEAKKPEPEHSHKEEVKFKIPPPQEIQKKSYSLKPDMATGWAPKSDLPVPIPMVFSNRRVDLIVKHVLEKKHEKLKLCFLGPRFESTFYAWYDRPFAFPYAHIKSPHNMKFTNRAFCGQHWDAQDGLIFDSFFESGNLDCAIRVGDRQYDLYMRVDSNTRGHLHWFNFKVKNLQKLQKYQFNICNFQKNKSLYTRGQKPFIFSTKRFQKEKKGWEQCGDSVKYEQKPGKSARVLNTQYNSYYKLSFDYYTHYDNDEVQIAFCVPYTYSQLSSYLHQLEKKCSDKSFFSISKLCTSLGGLEVPLLIIHDKGAKQSSEESDIKVAKKCIVVSGRAHPGESNGSYMMEGFLDFICGDSRQARKLRSNFIFKVVPMLNPDGVSLGNYRTGISGRDFNREYRNPQKIIFPEVYSFKKLVTENKAIYRENLLMFLDFHGHSIKKNVFMYGPEFPIIQKHYYECRVFPKLLGNTTPMFRYYSCSFKISQCKVTTARAVLLRKLMIPFSYTIEASNGSFYDHQKLKDIPFTDATWIKMGFSIGKALAEYGSMIITSERIRIEKMLERRAKREMKIRKTSKGKNSCAPPAQQNQMVILSGVEDDKIKNIFQEIRRAQNERDFSRIEDDEISEGSSDDEGDKDDLSPQKLNILYTIIKNKKMRVPEKHRKNFDEEDHQSIKTIEHEIQNKEENEEAPLSGGDNPVVSEIQLIPFKDDQIFRQNGNYRGHLLRSRNNAIPMLGDQKKEKVAAKIINFSFIGHNKPFSSPSPRRSDNLVTQIQSDLLTKKQRHKDPIGDSKSNNSNNNKVLDLSERMLRQTFTGRSSSRDSDRFSMTYSNMTPRRLAGRLDDLKLRKILKDDYRI